MAKIVIQTDGTEWGSRVVSPSDGTVRLNEIRQKPSATSKLSVELHLETVTAPDESKIEGAE